MVLNTRKVYEDKNCLEKRILKWQENGKLLQAWKSFVMILTQTQYILKGKYMKFCVS